MWLFFALLTPFFWALVHVMDSHCVENVFEKPWMGVVIGATTSACVYLAFLPFFLFFIDFALPSPGILLLGLVAGGLIQISQAFYFKALSYSDVGVISAYWNLTPAILPIASYFVLSSVLTPLKYLGILILILTSVAFCLIDTNLETRWRAFFLMLAASILQVGALIMEDIVYSETSYFVGFYSVISGLIIAGLLPMAFKRARSRFSKNIHILRPALKFFFIIEICNLVALATSQRAIDLGIPSLVAAVETTVPGYIFVMSIILYATASKFGDKEALTKLPTKLALVTVMVIGVVLVY